MPHIYPHKEHGWQIIYRVYFLDGSRKDKFRFRKNKKEALIVLTDVERLETLSRRRSLTKEEILYSLNSGYITEAEAEGLSGRRVSRVFTWLSLKIKYEQWSRSHCRAVTHQINTYRRDNIIDRLPEDPRDVTEDTIDDYITRRQENGIKSGTINKELVIIRKLLDYIDYDNNPARINPFLKVTDKRLPRSLAPDE